MLLLRALSHSFKIATELFMGIYYLRNIGKAVSFFGSAREVLPEKYYKDSEIIASSLARKGFTVITGGGPGIMRSANKGAISAKQNESVGVSIKLPFEQKSNKYLTRNRMFSSFPVRKNILYCESELYIFFPGGYGTMDELCEALTLIQTGKSLKIPIILYGEEFWGPFVKFVENDLRDKFKTISKGDENLYVLFDDVDETLRYIEKLTLEENRVCNDFNA